MKQLVARFNEFPLSRPSHGVLPRPLGGLGVERRRVLLVELRRVGHQRVVGVRDEQQREDCRQRLAQGVRRLPCVLEDVEADAALVVDVRVQDLRREVHLRRLEGVLLGELHLEHEGAAGVGRVAGSEDARVPRKHVRLVHRRGAAVRRRLALHVLLLLDQPTKRHDE